MALISEYSPNWKDLGSMLLYQSPTFQFRSGVIITEFEQCLINRLISSKLYHNIDPQSITPYNEEFLKMIEKESQDYSVVIISNIFTRGKLTIDSLKYKFEMFCKAYDIPILALFALKKNRLSKPHTGMWDFLNGFFMKYGNSKIQKACVVSDFGGRLFEQTLRNGKIRVKVDGTDMDRAFANNVGIPYHTISEYIRPDEYKEKFNWNSNCLAPELRQQYIDKLSEYQNPNIFSRLFENGIQDKYLILVYGAPRSGKTTLSREILRKWRASRYGKSNVIKRLGLDKYTQTKRLGLAKKYLADRINLIIDGGCHTEKLREPFEELAKQHHIRILYVEVNPGLGMSHILNHVAVETAKDENIVLYDLKEYHHYKSMVVRPKSALLYCPIIKKNKYIMDFRYTDA
jgi:DNA 3'-phosphatase